MSITTYKDFYITTEEPVGSGGIMLYNNIIIGADKLDSLTQNITAGIPSLSGAIDEVASTVDQNFGVTTAAISAINVEFSGIFPILPGMVIDYAGASAPTGYLLCDGSTYNASSYPNLYAIIGTTYGTGGAGTFNVPDCRGAGTISTNPSPIGTINTNGYIPTRTVSDTVGSAYLVSVSGDTLVPGFIVFNKIIKT